MTRRRYSITLTDPFQKGLDELVDSGLFMDHQHVIREALRDIFKRHNLEVFSPPIKEAG